MNVVLEQVRRHFEVPKEVMRIIVRLFLIPRAPPAPPVEYGEAYCRRISLGGTRGQRERFMFQTEWMAVEYWLLDGEYIDMRKFKRPDGESVCLICTRETFHCAQHQQEVFT